MYSASQLFILKLAVSKEMNSINIVPDNPRSHEPISDDEYEFEYEFEDGEDEDVSLYSSSSNQVMEEGFVQLQGAGSSMESPASPSSQSSSSRTPPPSAPLKPSKDSMELFAWNKQTAKRQRNEKRQMRWSGNENVKERRQHGGIMLVRKKKGSSSSSLSSKSKESDEKNLAPELPKRRSSKELLEALAAIKIKRKNSSQLFREGSTDGNKNVTGSFSHQKNAVFSTELPEAVPNNGTPKAPKRISSKEMLNLLSSIGRKKKNGSSGHLDTKDRTHRPMSAYANEQMEITSAPEGSSFDKSQAPKRVSSKDILSSIGRKKKNGSSGLLDAKDRTHRPMSAYANEQMKISAPEGSSFDKSQAPKRVSSKEMLRMLATLGRKDKNGSSGTGGADDTTLRANEQMHIISEEGNYSSESKLNARFRLNPLVGGSSSDKLKNRGSRGSTGKLKSMATGRPHRQPMPSY